MNKFNEFFNNIINNSNLSLDRELTIKEIRFIISKINEFFYTNYEGIGETEALGMKFEYFSEFHKFWEKNHKEILNPQIIDDKCEKMADILHEAYIKYGKKIFLELYDTFELSPEEICKIRYFSANQDFRGSRDFKFLADKYLVDPSIFDKQNVFDNPEDFLKNIKVTSLSQNDKRIKYAKTAAKLLIDNNIEPFDLLNFCHGDIAEVRNLLINNNGSGFGNKKTDMFLRDMVVLNVWPNTENFEKLDVASDINTVKVALRSGILKTEIVLLSSFLDIFCHQYSLIDEMNAKAWRKVWEKWKDKYPNETIESPSLFDYFVYRIIGKEFCKEDLCYFICEDGEHKFYWHSSRNKTCQTCYAGGVQGKKAILIKKMLPCTCEDGQIVIKNNKFVKGADALLYGILECPLADVCESRSPSFKKLNPPKSISILGQTGWDSARTRGDVGGGGLMS